MSEADVATTGGETGGNSEGNAGDSGNTTATNASGPSDLDTANAGNTDENTGQQSPSTSEGGDFSVPDEYREKPWIERYKFESTEDVFKALDNAQELIGKKTVLPIDYDTASAEQIAEHHKKLVPESADAYKFSEDADPEFSKAVVPVLQEAGIHPAQLKTLEPAINKIASEMVGAQYEADRSEDGYFELTEKAFGENHKDVVVQLETFYQDNASDDVKGFLDNASNKERAIFDQISKSIIDAKDAEIARIKQEYGVEETGAQGEGEPASQKVDIDEQISAKRKELNDLGAKAGQKDWAAINKAKEDLKGLYDKKVKMRK